MQKLQNEGRKPVVQTPTADSAVQAALSAVVERWPKLVNDNEALLRRGRYLTTDIMIEIGTQPYYISIDRGRISAVQRGPIVMKSWSFAVRGGEDAWRKFWERYPPPHFHDIFALAKQGAFRIDGDYQPLITNLLYFKELLAAPRTLQAKVQ
ncbi:MAG: hypothetical protein WBQ24_06265 [Xanthobacteraceae bacterium]